MNPEGSLRDFVDLLNALQCGALITDSAGRLAAVNDRAAAMFGRNREALIGAGLLDLYSDGADRAKLERCLAQIEHGCETESDLDRPDGSRLAVMVAGRPLGTGAQLSQFRLITLIDISRQKRAETSLREHYREMVNLSDTVLKQALALKHYAHDLEVRVHERTVELHDANMDALYMLAIASEAKDEETGAHVQRIQFHAELLARELGLNEKESRQVGYSAILHDVGKIHVPDEILHKPGDLDDDEWILMRQHTLVGERILSDRPFFSTARRIARSHHENWDGTGYPDRLSRETIPLPARIVRVADVYDALLSRRPYKPAWTSAEATRTVLDGAGTLFDPQVIDVFKTIQRRGDLVSESGGLRRSETRPASGVVLPNSTMFDTGEVEQTAEMQAGDG